MDGLEQERRNSIANALELRLSCTNPSIFACRLFFAHSSDVLGSLEDVGTVAIPELINAEKDGGSAAYPTLNKWGLNIGQLFFSLIFYKDDKD